MKAIIILMVSFIASGIMILLTSLVLSDAFQSLEMTSICVALGMGLITLGVAFLSIRIATKSDEKMSSIKFPH